MEIVSVQIEALPVSPHYGQVAFIVREKEVVGRDNPIGCNSCLAYANMACDGLKLSYLLLDYVESCVTTSPIVDYVYRILRPDLK